MKNTQDVAIRIKTSDIKLSLSTDVVSGIRFACTVYMYMYMYIVCSSYIARTYLSGLYMLLFCWMASY